MMMAFYYIGFPVQLISIRDPEFRYSMNQPFVQPIPLLEVKLKAIFKYLLPTKQSVLVLFRHICLLISNLM